MNVGDIDIFLEKLDRTKPTVLSIDLDDTLVNRKKGGNFVMPETLDVLHDLKKNSIIIIPNTGRDIVGIGAFLKNIFKANDAILGSGSIVMHDNNYTFMDIAEIDPKLTNIFLEAIKNNVAPFIDLYHDKGRTTFYHESFENKDLFYSQNPLDWFDDGFPPAYRIDQLSRNMPDNIFRIEIPIYTAHKELYESLIDKRKDCLELLENIIPLKAAKDIYALKKKSFFNEKYKGQLIFARFEKNKTQIHKGIGLKKWFELTKKNPLDFNIIHIGDQDSGLINDTIIKRALPNAHIVMVGNKCSLHNPEVDLYLRDATVDEEVYRFLQGLSLFTLSK